MSTPTIVRKVSNVTNNNDPTSNNPTTTSSPPIRPTRVVRVLSKPANSTSSTTTTTTATTTENATSSSSTTVTVGPPEQLQTTNTPDNTSSTDLNNNTTTTTATTVKKVVRRVVVKRAVGESGGGTGVVPISNDQPSLTNNNNNIALITNQTANNNNNNNTTTTTNSQPIQASTTSSVQPISNSPPINNLSSKEINNNNSPPIQANNEVNNNQSTPTTPRANIGDRWMAQQKTSNGTTSTDPIVPKRAVRINRNSLKNEEKVSIQTDSSSATTTTTITSSTATIEPNKNTITSSSNDFGSKLVSAASKTTNTGSHQTSKSMNDVMPETTKSVKDLASKLAPSLKVLTPEQLMMEKKMMDKGSDVIRPLRPLEIATWYGGSVSVATEDPMFDHSSIDDLKREAPDIYYANFLFNPLFDEQSACDTPIITMSSQEILQYNFVVELMRKKHSNLLTLDPIVFEEEMRNASSMSSLTLSKNLSSGHTHTDSVTSTEDVLSREDIGYPIQKCSKNWKYQLKKKRENAKTYFNPNDGMFTPRASIQLQSGSPSSPATTNSIPVNPLFDHLYYMPCWKHQLQLDQIAKRGNGEQRKVQ